MDYIDGWKFSEIADFTIDFDRRDFSFDMFKSNAIIYCKTDFIPHLFKHLQFSGRKYVLISHMSDIPIDAVKFLNKPVCIKKWFAQNAIYDHPDLISIPLGVENHKGMSKGPFTNHKWLEENINRLRNNFKEPALYCHWNPVNNPDRAKISSILKEKNNVVVQDARLNYEAYIENMSKYKFIVCPPGNGVDTHRLWEAIYIGCTPVTLKHRIYKDYDLPIIQVNNWAEITPELLEKSISTHTDQAYMSYWKKRIVDEFSKL